MSPRFTVCKKNIYTPWALCTFCDETCKQFNVDINLVLRFVQKLMPNILLQKAHEKMISIKSYTVDSLVVNIQGTVEEENHQFTERCKMKTRLKIFFS